MGLLERNPRASLRSVRREAAKGLLCGAVLFGLYAWLKPEVAARGWLWILPLFLLLGGAVAAIQEWQVPGC
jgi:hypothetical protein